MCPATLEPEVLESNPDLYQKLCVDLQDLTPQFSKPYARHLFDSGDEKAARRLDLCGKFFRRHQDSDGHLFWENSQRCMMSTCPFCSRKQAADLIDRYSVLSSTIGSRFVRLEVPHLIGEKVRKLLSKHLGKQTPILSNTGWRRGSLTTKLLVSASAASFPMKLTASLRALDSSIIISEHEPEQFRRVLEYVLAPDLPGDFAALDQLRALKRKVKFQGMSQADRKKLFVKDTPPPLTNNFPQEGEVYEQLKLKCPEEGCTGHAVRKVPKCPMCGKPSIRHTQWTTRVLHTHEEQWTEIEIAEIPCSKAA